jgi:hypothetical protein
VDVVSRSPLGHRSHRRRRLASVACAAAQRGSSDVVAAEAALAAQLAVVPSTQHWIAASLAVVQDNVAAAWKREQRALS